MKSHQVNYDSKKKVFTAITSSELETFFVFPPNLQEGDYLPTLHFMTPESQEAFHFDGMYNNEDDNLEFLFDGPTGFSYKISLSIDPGSHESYLWKAKKHGQTQGFKATNDAIIHVPRYMCLEESTALSAEDEVFSCKTLVGPTISRTFCTMRLKIKLIQGDAWHKLGAIVGGDSKLRSQYRNSVSSRGDFEVVTYEIKILGDGTIVQDDNALRRDSDSRIKIQDNETFNILRNGQGEGSFKIDRNYSVTITSDANGRILRETNRSERLHLGLEDSRSTASTEGPESIFEEKASQKPLEESEKPLEGSDKSLKFQDGPGHGRQEPNVQFVPDDPWQTAFTTFSQERLAQLQQESPDKENNELNRMVSVEWMNLDNMPAETPYKTFEENRMHDIKHENPDRSETDLKEILEDEWKARPKASWDAAYDTFKAKRLPQIQQEKPDLVPQQHKELIQSEWRNLETKPWIGDFNAFEESKLPQFKKDYPDYDENQLRELLQHEWEEHENMPWTAAYETFVTERLPQLEEENKKADQGKLVELLENEWEIYQKNASDEAFEAFERERLPQLKEENTDDVGEHELEVMLAKEWAKHEKKPWEEDYTTFERTRLSQLQKEHQSKRLSELEKMIGDEWKNHQNKPWEEAYNVFEEVRLAQLALEHPKVDKSKLKKMVEDEWSHPQATPWCEAYFTFERERRRQLETDDSKLGAAEIRQKVEEEWLRQNKGEPNVSEAPGDGSSKAIRRPGKDVAPESDGKDVAPESDGKEALSEPDLKRGHSHALVSRASGTGHEHVHAASDITGHEYIHVSFDKLVPRRKKKSNRIAQMFRKT